MQSNTEPLDLCDCELSHNGMGMVGRECDCPIRYQRAAARAGTQALRMRIALKILREWSMGHRYSAHVVICVRNWIDDGMNGPVPWPGGAFFEEWAAEQGLSNVDGFCGYRLTMQLEQPHA